MNPVIFHRVQRIVGDVFSIPIAHITLESSADTIESWDSLQHLNLILALEQEFGLQFTPEEIERLSSVGDINALLEQKLRGSGRVL
jgi:acyl carrier protein